MILSVLSSPALVSGLMVVRAKNPVHSVLFPILVFCDTSGLLILLGLDFSAMPIDISRKLRMSSNFYFFFYQQAIESLPGGALLGGACEDCNFKDDDQSGFDRYRHSRLRLLHINGEGAIQ